MFGALNEWFFSNLCFDNFTLDFDSTVITRCGEQEGSAKGYNPKRPGRTLITLFLPLSLTCA